MNSNQEEKRNYVLKENQGRGLFYAVIAIATFIIMSVGATFAYFTATTQSTNTSVSTGSTTLELQYISYETAWSKNDLIPAGTAIVQYSVENQNDTTTSTPATEEGVYLKNGNNTMCKDDYGNSICSVYVFQVTNSAQSPQSVSLNIVSEDNGFTNLNAMAYELSVEEENKDVYKSEEAGNGVNDPIFRKNASDLTEGAITVTDGNGTMIEDPNYKPILINRKGVSKSLLEYITTEDDGTTKKGSALDRQLVTVATEEDKQKKSEERMTRIADGIEIEGAETKTFAIVLYIKNLDDVDQTDEDAAKNFTGQVVVSSGDGNKGVSGYIKAALEQEENGTEVNG